MDLLLNCAGFDLRIAKIFATNVRRLLGEFVVPRNREHIRLRNRGQLTVKMADGRRRVLRVNPVPPLYQSGIIYAEDPPGAISLADIPTVLTRGWGHCAHLSAWLCAELLERGIDATIRLKWMPKSMGLGRLYHVQVRLAPRYGYGWVGLGQVDDKSNHLGQILDPSRALGMGVGPRLIGNLYGPEPEPWWPVPRLPGIGEAA